MSVVRVLVIASFAAALAACSPATTRFQDDGAAVDSKVESSPLPPIPGTDSTAPAKTSEAPAAKPSTATSDTWRPYAASKARGGKWNGNTSWKYPPQKRASAAQPAPSSAIPAPVAADNNWADKWVPEPDRSAFDDAIKVSMGGSEGHWKTATGSFGTAFPAVKSGKCATIELMLSPVNGGLPVTSRGSIIRCS